MFGYSLTYMLMERASEAINGKDKTPEEAREIGQRLLQNAVKLSFDKNRLHYKSIERVKVILDGKHESEISMILCCSKGVFVIDNHHWDGIIKGRLDKDEWLVVKDGFRQTTIYHFLNPIKESEFHIKALDSFVGEEVPLFPLITFSSNNIGRSSKENIINIIGFPRFMNTVDTGYNFSDEEIDKIYENILSIFRK